MIVVEGCLSREIAVETPEGVLNQSSQGPTALDCHTFRRELLG